MSIDRFEKYADAMRPTYRTASEYVTEVLRGAIRDNVLPHGSPLRQEELAATLNVSRMPIREALRLLEAEGLVEFVPRKGAVVSTVSAEDMVAVFELRLAIEKLAMKHSVPHLTDEDIAEASRLLNEMAGCDDFKTWLGLHRNFHLTLCRHAHERILSLTTEQHSLIERYLLIERATMSNGQEDDAEHRQILAACSAKNVTLLMSLLDAHIGEAGRELAATLQQRDVDRAKGSRAKAVR